MLTTSNYGGIQMNVQTFKTMCDNCGDHELVTKVIDYSENNEIIIDFLEGMEFYCENCGASTFITVNKNRGNS